MHRIRRRKPSAVSRPQRGGWLPVALVSALFVEYWDCLSWDSVEFASGHREIMWHPEFLRRILGPCWLIIRILLKRLNFLMVFDHVFWPVRRYLIFKEDSLRLQLFNTWCFALNVANNINILIELRNLHNFGRYRNKIIFIIKLVYI